MACGTFKAAVDPDIAGLDSPLRLEATKVSQRWLDVFCVRLCLTRIEIFDCGKLLKTISV